MKKDLGTTFTHGVQRERKAQRGKDLFKLSAKKIRNEQFVICQLIQVFYIYIYIYIYQDSC